MKAGQRGGRLADLIEREGDALQVRVSADGLRIPLQESSQVVLDNLGGARVAIVKRANTVRVEAAVPELAELVRWNLELCEGANCAGQEEGADLDRNDSPSASNPQSVEEMIYDYRVALAGRL